MEVVAAAWGRIAAQVDRCILRARPGGGAGSAYVAFDGDTGQAAEVDVRGFEGTPATGCVAGVIRRRMRLPRFANATFALDIPFHATPEQIAPVGTPLE